MKPSPLPHNTTAENRAISGLDLAFTHLSDRSFASLTKTYQRLADAVLRVVAERAHFAS